MNACILRVGVEVRVGLIFFCSPRWGILVFRDVVWVFGWFLFIIHCRFRGHQKMCIEVLVTSPGRGTIGRVKWSMATAGMGLMGGGG